MSCSSFILIFLYCGDLLLAGITRSEFFICELVRRGGLLWTLVCLSMSFFWVKPRSQIGHLYGLSPVCVRMWTRTFSGRPKRLKQTWHWNGFTGSWTIWCWRKFAKQRNVALHIGHPNGRSPVWIRLCVSRVNFELNPLPQNSQWWVVSPVCVRSWYCFDEIYNNVIIHNNIKYFKTLHFK